MYTRAPPFPVGPEASNLIIQNVLYGFDKSVSVCEFPDQSSLLDPDLVRGCHRFLEIQITKNDQLSPSRYCPAQVSFVLLGNPLLALEQVVEDVGVEVGTNHPEDTVTECTESLSTIDLPQV